MSDQHNDIDQIIEAALFAAGEPLSAERLQQMFAVAGRPSVKDIKASLESVSEQCEQRGVELVEVASGYRFQAKPEFAEFLQRLWEKKPPKYSRAFLETLALVVYRQPITRGEIENVRGVAVSSNIMKTLQDRAWVKIVGTRDVPGKPALFGTTKQFLDDFNLKNLSDLPPLQAIMDVEALEEKLGLQFDLAVEGEAISEDGSQAETEIGSEVISEDESEPEAFSEDNSGAEASPISEPEIEIISEDETEAEEQDEILVSSLVE